MTKDEYIGLRVAELTARQRYAGQMVMNKELAHEAKMCDLQITELLKQRDFVTVRNKPLPKIGPPVQYWTQGSNPPQLMHTDDHGIDTVLCENHLTDSLIPCSNCIQPCPVNL